MANLKNHPGMWLRDDAAKAFDALEARHGVFTVTSAGRTVAEQQGLINRWFEGGIWNRPPYLYEPARPPETSAHVRDGGVAVDIQEWERFKIVAAEYGFYQTFNWDVVHFEYVGSREEIGNIVSSMEDKINRLEVVIGGTFERGKNGESISQRIDQMAGAIEEIRGEVNRLAFVVGNTYARAQDGDTLSTRLDEINRKL